MDLFKNELCYRTNPENVTNLQILDTCEDNAFSLIIATKMSSTILCLNVFLNSTLQE